MNAAGTLAERNGGNYLESRGVDLAEIPRLLIGHVDDEVRCFDGFFRKGPVRRTTNCRSENHDACSREPTIGLEHRFPLEFIRAPRLHKFGCNCAKLCRCAFESSGDSVSLKFT